MTGFISAHVALFNSTDEVSYLTAFITRSKYRRLGVGFPVFEKAIELARHRRVVLDSVPGMSSTYEKRGFVIQFNFCKMQGALSPCYESSAPSCQKIPKVFIQPVTEDNTSRICHYDRKISGIDRELFIRKVLLKSTTQATCAVTAQNVVVGLLVLHTVDSGHSNVFSFYADDLNIAKLLLQDVIAGQTTPMSLRGLFVPQVNPDSMKLFSMFGLKQDPADVRCPRMSNRNLADGLHWCKVFALCCFGYSYV